MAKDPVTRFAARTKRGWANLFSVRERPDGDLIVAFRPTFRTTGTATNSAMSLWKCSIHPSVRSEKGGRTLTVTQREKSGEETRTVIFIDCRRDQLLWPLFLRMTPDLDSDLHALNAKAGDEIIPVAEYDPAEQTLCFAVLAVDAQRQVPLHENYNATRRDWSSSSIIVVPFILPEHSMVDGQTTYFLTSSMTRDGVPLTKVTQKPHMSWRPRHVTIRMAELTALLEPTYRQTMLALIERNKLLAPDAKRFLLGCYELLPVIPQLSGPPPVYEKPVGGS